MSRGRKKRSTLGIRFNWTKNEDKTKIRHKTNIPEKTIEWLTHGLPKGNDKETLKVDFNWPIMNSKSSARQSVVPIITSKSSPFLLLPF
jgi:hypothetical protein